MFVFIVGGVCAGWLCGGCGIVGIMGVVGCGRLRKDHIGSYGVQTEVKMASETVKTPVGLVCGVQTEVMMASVTIESLGLGSLWPFTRELWDVHMY